MQVIDLFSNCYCLVVVEGMPLDNSPVLRLLNNQGLPAVGQRAIAMISHKNDVEASDFGPLLFTDKDLINCISNVSNDQGRTSNVLIMS